MIDLPRLQELRLMRSLRVFELSRRAEPAVPLREVIMFSLWSDRLVVRYDFAYTDPASHRRTQIGVDATAADGAELDECIVPEARATILRMLRRKCGVQLALQNRIELELPRTCRSRYV